MARSLAGNAVVNNNISIRFKIRQGSPGGVSIHEETHQTLTTSGGIFSVAVGGGTAVSGSFDVDWKYGPYFLNIAIDQGGGKNFIDFGSTQLLSVPYALHSEEALKAIENDKKSVNYLGLVPHLIESVKNLKNANEAAMAMIRELQNDQRVRQERKTK